MNTETQELVDHIKAVVNTKAFADTLERWGFTMFDFQHMFDQGMTYSGFRSAISNAEQELTGEIGDGS